MIIRKSRSKCNLVIEVNVLQVTTVSLNWLGHRSRRWPKKRHSSLTKRPLGQKLYLDLCREKQTANKLHFFRSLCYKTYISYVIVQFLRYSHLARPQKSDCKPFQCLKAITMSLLIGISMIKFVPKTFTRRQESNPGSENVF